MEDEDLGVEKIEIRAHEALLGLCDLLAFMFSFHQMNQSSLSNLPRSSE